jgi:hypothetical protein
MISISIARTALGALLYEMLAGSVPFRGKRWRRSICSIGMRQLPACIGNGAFPGRQKM